MPDPTLVLVLILSGEATDFPTASMQGAMQRTLGSSTEIAREAVATMPSDDEAVGLGRAKNARAVVELRWADSQHASVALHLYFARDGTWIDRKISFAAGDPPEERGRALGFTVATVLDPYVVDASVSPSSPSSPPSPPVRSGENPVRASLGSDAARTRDGAPPAIDEPRSTVDASAPRAHDSTEAARAVWVGAAGVASTAESSRGGATLEGAWVFSDRVALLLSGSFVAGSLRDADASVASWSITGGALLNIARSSGARPIELGIRAQAGVARDSVARRTLTLSRWSPIAALGVETAWWLVPSFGLTAMVGAASSLGSTRVDVGTDVVAVTPVAWPLASLGVRVRMR